jgi:hypothetical protein
MMPARKRAALILAGVVLVAAAAAAIAVTRIPKNAAPQQRPTLLLLTSLPLMFGEQFSLSGGGSPALRALQSRYRVVPISVTDPAELKKGELMLMAHPLAQPAEELVALDQWVRGGGHLLLLADPLLEWPSSRPLGDALRPPPMFMDTGLLWGLRLDAPEQRGKQARKLGGRDVLTSSPGSLEGSCDVSADRLVARCRIGKGRATVVADADLLDTADLGGGAEHNLDALLGELASLGDK